MAKAKAKSRRKGRKLAIAGAKEVRRTTFDGLPIVDAAADMILNVHTEDVQAAKGSERDATNCILARACARDLKSSRVAFFRRTAYIDLPDSKGNRSVTRFILDKDAKAIVAAFDRGKSVRGEVTVRLLAPTQSQTLDACRESSRRLKARRRKAVINGEIVGKVMHNARFHKKPSVADLDVRRGIGMVHNTLKKEKKAVGT